MADDVLNDNVCKIRCKLRPAGILLLIGHIRIVAEETDSGVLDVIHHNIADMDILTAASSVHCALETQAYFRATEYAVLHDYSFHSPGEIAAYR